jgi:anti-sigma-K factor RskA
MNCIECEEIISDYVDGALDLGEQTKIEHHLANCEPCRAVRDDLLQIVHFSKQLPLHTPVSDLWTRIQTEIEAEKPKTLWSRFILWLRNFNAREFNFSIPRLAAVAAAFVLMASLGAAVWNNVNKTATTFAVGVVPGINLVPEDQITLSVKVPEFKDFEQRIKQLNESVEQKKVDWAPELQQSFERNIFNVDQSLKECWQQVNNNPSDATSVELLKNAYHEKVRVLEGFVNF